MAGMWPVGRVKRSLHGAADGWAVVTACGAAGGVFRTPEAPMMPQGAPAPEMGLPEGLADESGGSCRGQKQYCYAVFCPRASWRSPGVQGLVRCIAPAGFGGVREEGPLWAS